TTGDAFSFGFASCTTGSANSSFGTACVFTSARDALSFGTASFFTTGAGASSLGTEPFVATGVRDFVAGSASCLTTDEDGGFVGSTTRSLSGGGDFSFGIAALSITAVAADGNGRSSGLIAGNGGATETCVSFDPDIWIAYPIP